MFKLEILSLKQISHVKSHLLELHSQKKLILNFHNLLDFRFAQGSIGTIHDSIIYTLKILIFNPIEFSLFRRLATINYSNQSEIITTPWKLLKRPMKIFSHKCQLMYPSNYLCYQIISEEAKQIIISTNVPLILAYPLPYNMTLISSNYPIAIDYNKVKTTIQVIHLLQGNNIYIQGHNIDNNLGEFKQPEVLPLIIENHQSSFEPLKTLILPTMATPAFKQFGIEFIHL